MTLNGRASALLRELFVRPLSATRNRWHATLACRRRPPPLGFVPPARARTPRREACRPASEEGEGFSDCMNPSGAETPAGHGGLVRKEEPPRRASWGVRAFRVRGEPPRPEGEGAAGQGG